MIAALVVWATRNVRGFGLWSKCVQPDIANRNLKVKWLLSGIYVLSLGSSSEIQEKVFHNRVINYSLGGIAAAIEDMAPAGKGNL
jgi:hypothetical protein